MAYAPRKYGPHQTLYNRWKRWSDKDIFAEMMVGLAADHGEQKQGHGRRHLPQGPSNSVQSGRKNKGGMDA